MKQEAALDAGDQSSVLPSDLHTKYDVSCDCHQSYRCSHVLQAEIEQLRKRLADADMKTARVTHDVSVVIPYVDQT